MQTIIGSGGTIGTPLALELKKYTDHIRLVSRNPKKVNDSDELYPADMNDPGQLDNAIAGSEVVYVVIGFEYKLKVWQQTWPVFMQEVIRCCKKHKARLVFFDNVYMYDKAAIPFMTEDSPVHAPSKKGKVRQAIHEMILAETASGELTALIARSADFYGPANKNSALNLMVLDNLAKGKKAQAFGDIQKVHTYTFTPDAAIATALLGNTIDAYNQVWHLPTTKEKLTGEEWIRLIAAELHTAPRWQVIPVWMIRLLGLFMPMMREFPEMMYQYEQDYFFDSSKFEKKFGISATSPKEAVRIIVEQLKSSQGN